jgi:molecular chaperone HtpG
VEFKTTLEKRAAEAPSLEAFSRFSLYGVREAVAKLLELIGREGIFREYTRHDISHVDKLLQMLGWIVPPDTLSRMTVADCLMTTLAVYFHDLGMLVTRDEFDRRSESKFSEFKDRVFAEKEGKDYRDKVSKMPSDEAERFLYQEFVRQNHAERIRSWVTGKSRNDLGSANNVTEELDKLLDGLEGKFRKDLGLVCESHHLNDLEQFDKYKPSQPYGSDPQETANLQYCAILLRTADLLHITGDRAPSISFRMINPSDPKSIEEWHKQMPVISVRPRPGEDQEGNVSASAPMDTIEVSGLFKDPKGFFALTAYLNYATKELRKSNDWVELAKRRRGTTYDFPWRRIDDSGLEAEGFIDKQFEFTLDQAKILDLLTGQTLYNDTTVVLRELVQNSLDAIRLEWEHEAGLIKDGAIEIAWNSATRSLTVRDNGTGMTQNIVDAHFLKVGSSLYQDEEFKRAHPRFSAISRFGIGVLSAFMISDEIEVTTCHPDDMQARTLSLRSLHGKYLVRLIDKDSPELPKQILPHGTEITLRVRPSAELKDLASILRRWIAFPRCKVTVTIDGGGPVSIGFTEPKDALQEELARLNPALAVKSPGELADRNIRIEQRRKDGVTLAYAVQWSSAFQEWAFFSLLPTRDRLELPATGNCIEGVRVDSLSPGYQDGTLMSLANAVGPKAPKTNVARSVLEITPERKSLLSTVYELYCDHVRAEVEKLQNERGFSLTWALGEATWLLDTLLPSSFRHLRAADYEALLRACAEVPSIALEEHGARVGVSPKQLSEYDSFWTADSIFFSSAEALLREIPTSVAISQLAATIGSESLRLPPGPYISVQRPRSVAQRLAFQNREVNRIVLRRDQRQVDLRWGHIANPPLWRTALPDNGETQRVLQQLLGNIGSIVANGLPDMWIARANVETEGLETEVSIVSLGRTFILPGSGYSKYLIKLLDRLNTSPDIENLAAYAIALHGVSFTDTLPNAAEYVKQQLAFISRGAGLGYLILKEDPELIAVLQSTSFKSFNPQAWIRGQQPA